MEPTYLLLSYSILVALAMIEAIVLLTVHRGYDWRAALCSLVDLVIREYLVGALAVLGPAEWLLRWAWAHRIATIPLDTAAAVLALFLGQEFCYYWAHRCSHRVRLLWANHAVHHSTNQLCLSAAVRFGWTNRLVGITLFFTPLVWLGFAPHIVFIAVVIDFIYQFYTHAEWIPKLGPLEWVLNTPSHHRVHHAANPEYRDKNFGGVLIVFDRLFGTFAAERADVPCRYGLVVPLHSYNPAWIACHEFVALGRDLWRARGWRDLRRALIGEPRAAALPAS